MSFFSKVKWVLGVLMIFMLILATNLIDRSNFIKVRDSVISIYDDRLVASNLILKMNNALHRKHLDIVSNDTVEEKSQNQNFQTVFEGSIELFETTRLTSNEAEIFDKLKENYKVLIDQLDARESQATLESSVDKLKQNLVQLKEIQMIEGQKQLSKGQKAVDTVELFTQMEIYFLIVLAVVVQVIIMYQPRKK
ncbi:MAG: chemotaxis protein [Bacteroidota bacterium]